MKRFNGFSQLVTGKLNFKITKKASMCSGIALLCLFSVVALFAGSPSHATHNMGRKRNIKRPTGLFSGDANPNQIAILHSYKQNTTPVFTVSYAGTAPVRAAYDGRNMWITSYSSSTATHATALQGNTGKLFCTDNLGKVGALGVVFDGAHIWVTGFTSNSLYEIDPDTCVTQKTITGFSNPYYPAFDGTYIWVPNSTGANCVSRVLAKAPFTVTNIVPTGYNGSGCTSAAFDGTYINVVADNQLTVYALNSAGATVGSIPAGSGQLFDIAYDGVAGSNDNGNPSLWVTDRASNLLIELDSGPASCFCVLNTYPTNATPQGVAFDGNDIWVSETGSNTVSMFAIDDSGYTGDTVSFTKPAGLAFDGASMWVAGGSSKVGKM
jgi:hypothetical protein